MFFIRALEKIVTDPEIKRSQYAQLKLSCETVLQEVKAAQLKNEGRSDKKQPSREEDIDENSSTHSSENSSLIGSNSSKLDWTKAIDTEKYFVPLELACSCDVSRVVATALDCLQKLLAFGQLTGNYSDSLFPNRKLIDRIVETICRCYIGLDTDEGVQLQIIKALLTVVTCQHVEIHEGTLLLALRTCYNIHLSTKSQTNQITARAMLTQMIHVIFSKMESELSSSLDKENNNYVEEYVKSVAQFTESESIKQEDNSESLSNDNADDSGIQASISSNDPTECNGHNNDEESETSKTKEDSNTETPKEENNSDEKSDEATNAQNGNDPNPTDNSRKISLAHNEVEITLPENAPQFIHILQKDAFLVFWSLCKHSVKYLTDDTSSEPKLIDPRARILSLTLLRTIIENSGPVFRSNYIFTTAIKQYLCESLAINLTSTVPELFQIIVDIYKILIFNFRKYLKKEIEVFFENVLFPVFTQEHYPPEPKRIISQLIQSICEDISCLEYLYKNFDCDTSATNVFERLTSYLSSLSQGSPSSSGNKAEDDRIMMESLESIVRVFNSMMKWTDSNYQQEDTAVSLDKELPDQIRSLKRTDSKSPELTVKILEKADFKDKEFVPCLMSLVDTFRFPSDAVQLDNILIYLSSRYCECNPHNKTILCADIAYGLAYAILELADGFLVSKSNIYKLSKEQFVKLNRGIFSCPILSEEFLAEVYSLLLEHFASSRRSIREYDSFNLSRRPPISHKQCGIAKKMFKIVSLPFLTALSTGLKESDFTKVSDLCFEGMRLGIRIACSFHLKYERDAYVQILCRFTQVGIKEVKAGRLNIKITTKKTTVNTTTDKGVTTAVVTTTTEMKSKSIDAIQATLTVAETDGNHLGSAWLDILKCVSQIETTRLLAISDAEKEATERSKSPSGSRWTSWAGVLADTMEVLMDPLRDEVSHMDPSVKKSIATSVDKIFTDSVNLSGDGIVDFIKALCAVSLNELATETPKMFSLHKIVNVANANMHRISLQLSKIWKVLGDYLVHLGCSSDVLVSSIAIDSLFEMALTLLQKEELANYRFQEFFLWPFEEILRNTQSLTKLTLVMGCVFKLVDTHSSKLHSGWKAIFSIFEYLLSSSDGGVISEAFQAVEKVVESYEKDLSSVIISVQDTVHCLAEFACKTDSEDISVTAVRLIGRCSKLLVLSMEQNPGLKQNDIIWVRGWLPIFNEITAIKTYCTTSGIKLDLRTRALTEMFRIIKTDGVVFENHWWPELFKIIFDIFESLKLSAKDKTAPPKNSTQNDFTCYYCYYYVQFAIVDVITAYFKIIGSVEMESFLRNIEWSFYQDDKQLARSGVYCLQELIAHNGSKFTENNWNVVCNFIKAIVESTQRVLCLSDIVSAKQETYFDELDTKRIVHSELIKMLNKVILTTPEPTVEKNSSNESSSATSKELYTHLSIDNLYCLLDCLEEVFRFSRKHSAYVGEKLHEKHCNSGITLKNDLIVEEAQSILTQLKFLFRMFHDEHLKGSLEEIEDRLLETCVTVIDSFSCSQSYAHRSDWTDLICFCLNNILELPEDKFKVHATQYYPYLCEIVSLDLDAKLGSILRECFVRVGNLFGVFEYNTLEEPQK